LEDLSVDVKMLKGFLRKLVGKVLSGMIWLRKGVSGWLF
jgi:hypothetical protein